MSDRFADIESALGLELELAEARKNAADGMTEYHKWERTIDRLTMVLDTVRGIAKQMAPSSEFDLDSVLITPREEGSSITVRIGEGEATVLPSLDNEDASDQSFGGSM